MNQAQYREQSFIECQQRSWKFDKVDEPLYYTEMAEAGFFFSPTSRFPDRVICFFCHRNFSSWKQGSDPFLTHLQKSPNCSWALCKSLAKIPAEKVEQLGLSLPDLLSETLTKARAETFDSWPHAFKKGWSCTIPKLVQSGFYFTPMQQGADAVTCVACENTLLEWSSSDDPLESHFGLDSKCSYLLLAEKHGYPSCLDQNDDQSKTIKPSKSKKTKDELNARSDISSFTDTSFNSISSDCLTTGHRRSTRIQKNHERVLQEKLERRRRRKIKKDLAAGLITQEEADVLYSISNIHDISATTSDFSGTNTSLVFNSHNKPPEKEKISMCSINVLPETPASNKKTFKITTPTKSTSSNPHATQIMSPKEDIHCKKYPQRITYSRRLKSTSKNNHIESTSEDNSFNDSETDSIFCSNTESTTSISPSKYGSSNISNEYQDKIALRKSKRNLSKKSTLNLKKKSKNGKLKTKNADDPHDTILESVSFCHENNSFSTVDKLVNFQSDSTSELCKGPRRKTSNKTQMISIKDQSFNSKGSETKVANLTFPKFNCSSALSSSSPFNPPNLLEPAPEVKNKPAVQIGLGNRSEKQKASVLTSPPEENVSDKGSCIHKKEESDKLPSSSKINNTVTRRSKRIPVIAEKREQERLALKRKRREARLKALEKESKILKVSHTSNSSKNQLQKLPSITSTTTGSQSTSLNTSYVITADSSELIAKTFDETVKSLASPKQHDLLDSVIEPDNTSKCLERPNIQSDFGIQLCSSIPDPELESPLTRPKTNHSDFLTDKSTGSIQDPSHDKIDKDSSTLIISTSLDNPEVACDLNNNSISDKLVRSFTEASSPQYSSELPETFNSPLAQTLTNSNELSQSNRLSSPELQSLSINEDSFKKVSFLSLSDLERSLTLEELIHKLAKDQVSHLEANALARCQALDDLLTKAKEW